MIDRKTVQLLWHCVAHFWHRGCRQQFLSDTLASLAALSAQVDIIHYYKVLHAVTYSRHFLYTGIWLAYESNQSCAQPSILPLAIPQSGCLGENIRTGQVGTRLLPSLQPFKIYTVLHILFGQHLQWWVVAMSFIFQGATGYTETIWTGLLLSVLPL